MSARTIPGAPLAAETGLARHAARHRPGHGRQCRQQYRQGPAAGPLPLDAEEGSGGTGAHAILLDGDYLIYACPPARQIFWINKKTWKVKATWPVPGNRTHGMSWGKTRDTIWSSDSNLNAFFRHDVKTGNILSGCSFPTIAGDPLRQAGGRPDVSCDDMGWIPRFRI